MEVLNLNNQKREIQFGRLLAIASILSEKIESNGASKLNFRYADRFQRKPMDTFTKIHQEIMSNVHKFDESYTVLFDMFQEILTDMDWNDFDNKPLNGEYLRAYYSQRYSWYNDIMDTKEASELWGLSPDRIKRLCQTGEIQAKKIGNSWAIFKDQPNPKKYNTEGQKNEND